MITNILISLLAASAALQQEAPPPAAPDLQGAPEQALLDDFRVAPDNQAQMQLSFAPVVEQAAPAVVNVYTRRTVLSRVNPVFGRMLGVPREREEGSLGSGVIVDPSGVVVTNAHVVQDADELRVVLADRREYDATILLTEERYDLAVLKIEAEQPLPAVSYDSQGDQAVGDLVLAIGNPFGVGQTVTSGIISALARTDVGRSDFAAFIQTDAAINPGNSGGALIDMDGELIGVNTMIFSRSGGSNGIGFAIPVELVRRVVESAVSDGELVRPWLGARLQPVTRDLASAFGLDRPRGAVVNEIYPGAAADLAGLRQGDVILAIDGRDVNDEPGARFRLATRAAGEDAEFTLLRNGREIRRNVLVMPAPGVIAPEPLLVEGANPLAGAALIELTPAFNESVGIDPFRSGLVVSSVERGSAAAYFGFRPGDQLISLQGERVEALEDLGQTLAYWDGAESWPVEIERRGRRISSRLRL